MHEHHDGNQGAGARRRFEWNVCLSAEGNVERRAAPDRGPALRGSHSAPARFATSRSARANRAQLSRAQKSSAGNSSADKIFLGRVNLMPVGRVRLGSLTSVQPLHVIADALFQRESWLVTERAARVREIGLREVLIMGMRILDVIRPKLCAE